MIPHTDIEKENKSAEILKHGKGRGSLLKISSINNDNQN